MHVPHVQEGKLLQGRHVSSHKLARLDGCDHGFEKVCQLDLGIEQCFVVTNVGIHAQQRIKDLEQIHIQLGNALPACSSQIDLSAQHSAQKCIEHAPVQRRERASNQHGCHRIARHQRGSFGTNPAALMSAGGEDKKVRNIALNFDMAGIAF